MRDREVFPEMSEARNIVAVDFGAESGRLVLCRWNGNEGALEEIHRFPNSPSHAEGHLVWDLERLWQEVLRASKKPPKKLTGELIASASMAGAWITFCSMPPVSALAMPTAIVTRATNLPWRVFMREFLSIVYMKSPAFNSCRSTRSIN